MSNLCNVESNLMVFQNNGMVELNEEEKNARHVFRHGSSLDSLPYGHEL